MRSDRLLGIRARVGLCAAVLLPGVACDQATKQIARHALERGGVVDPLGGGLVRFQLTENPGAFMSLGDALPVPVRIVVFLGLVPIALAVLAFLVVRDHGHSRGAVASISLLAAGGLGNLLDRFLNDGAVIDFVSLGFGGLRTGIFNVADVAILAGALGLALSIGRPSPRDQAV